MTTARAEAIAVHVEAAKRLLAELEQHAEIALHALERDGGAEFFAAVDERSRILGQLDVVIEALAHQRTIDATSADDAESSALLAEMAQAAAAALESHEHLVAQTRRERDRLAAAVNRANRPDSVALQYGVASSVPANRTLSVTG